MWKSYHSVYVKKFLYQFLSGVCLCSINHLLKNIAVNYSSKNNWIFRLQMTLHHIHGVSGTFRFITWYLWVMTSRDKIKWPIVRATQVVSNKHKVKKFYWCMTSSEPKMCLWIFRPRMTLHDIPKISHIGVLIKHITINLLLKIQTCYHFE